MLPVDPALYALFLGTMTIFAITPGPANLYSIATGVRSGPRAALLGVAGMNTATLGLARRRRSGPWRFGACLPSGLPRDRHFGRALCCVAWAEIALVGVEGDGAVEERAWLWGGDGAAAMIALR